MVQYIKKNVAKLQSVQNVAARVVSGLRKFEHTTPILRDLNWLPVSSMLKYTVGILMFKCVKGLALRYLCSRFVTRATVHDRNTRSKNLLVICCWAAIFSVSISNYVELIADRYQPNKLY